MAFRVPRFWSRIVTARHRGAGRERAGGKKIRVEHHVRGLRIGGERVASRSARGREESAARVGDAGARDRELLARFGEPAVPRGRLVERAREGQAGGGRCVRAPRTRADDRCGLEIDGGRLRGAVELASPPLGGPPAVSLGSGQHGDGAARREPGERQQRRPRTGARAQRARPRFRWAALMPSIACIEKAAM